MARRQSLFGNSSYIPHKYLQYHVSGVSTGGYFPTSNCHIYINVGNPIINHRGRVYSIVYTTQWLESHPMVMTRGWFIALPKALPTLHPGVSYFSSPTGPPKNTRPFERLVDWRRIAVFLRNDEVGGAETYMVAYWYYMVIECYRML